MKKKKKKKKKKQKSPCNNENYKKNGNIWKINPASIQGWHNIKLRNHNNLF